ncbi:MAG TPA: acetyl-CoA hydrolase/transferase C-terminal domain-containing protein [Desulfomonilaceae bacterium]|nr:acetyl-CoA hydrolase/transferase C-terminal domain-containing protein [Desulfomonilaceae bacterium]
MKRRIFEEYKSKLRTADEAVQVVKSEDFVFYSHFAMFPQILDEALARRVGEVRNVQVNNVYGLYPAQVALCDPEHKSFNYTSYFFSPAERNLYKNGLCNYIPANYYEAPAIISRQHFPAPVIVFAKTTPMDENGRFNFGPAASFLHSCCQRADKIVVEVNEGVPTCLGGFGESVHISKVDYIVETEKTALISLPKPEASEAEKKIAAYIMEDIHDGCCLQLGIGGGVPNIIGSLIAESDLKDLGVHTEMMSDANMEMYLKGKVTGKYKYKDKTKMVYTLCLGSRDLYEFVDNNPACAIYQVDQTNTPEYIARNDNMISINNALQVDLWGQICSESLRSKHISGAGGQLDFVMGAKRSKGGKSFLCTKSTRMVGNRQASNVVPEVQGNVTVPRACTQYIVTEQGKINIQMKSTWQIADGVISLAHPEYRDDLIRAAEERGIWRRSNKK